MTADGQRTPSRANVRARILSRYARLLIAAHDRGEISAEDVYRAGMAAGRRVLGRLGDDAAVAALVDARLTAEDVQGMTRRRLVRDEDGEIQEPTPADEEAWTAREDWIRGGSL